MDLEEEVGIGESMLQLDGERLQPYEVRAWFQNPPGLVLPLPRSTMVVGARGSGKSTLLRYLKVFHDGRGIGLHISLASAISELQSKNAYGAQSTNLGREEELAVMRKSCALLAIEVAVRLDKRRINFSAEELYSCLPRTARPIGPGGLPAGWQRDLRAELAHADMAIFDETVNPNQLGRFLHHVGEECNQIKKPLVLLFDRADVVIPAAVVPILTAMDQPASYLAHVAMRPGPTSFAFQEAIHDLGLGDQIKLVQLGLRPYEEPWKKFARDAVRAQIPKIDELDDAIIERTLFYSRDSIRIAMEVIHEIASLKDSLDASAILEAALEYQKSILAARARSGLQEYHRSLSFFARKCMTLADWKEGATALEVHFNPSEESRLFVDPGEYKPQLQRFIDLGLRFGVFCMPSGEFWIPDRPPHTIQLNSLLAATSNSHWPYEPPVVFSRVEIAESQSLSVPMRRKDNSVFVAYRMNVEASKQFRQMLEAEVANHPKISDCKVVDGNVVPGSEWATEIRNRIRGAAATIADLTGLSQEVLFEVGFAYGLQKPVIPCFEEGNMSRPPWVDSIQYGFIGSSEQIRRVVHAIHELRRNPHRVGGRNSSIEGVAHRVVYISSDGEENEEYDEIKTVAERYSLEPILTSVADLETSADVRAAACAGLICGNLGHVEVKEILHYLAGTVMAAPEITSHGEPLNRQVVMILPESKMKFKDRASKSIAASARKCRPVVTWVEAGSISNMIEQYGKRYQNWLENQNPSELSEWKPKSLDQF